MTTIRTLETLADTLESIEIALLKIGTVALLTIAIMQRGV